MFDDTQPHDFHSAMKARGYHLPLIGELQPAIAFKTALDASAIVQVEAAARKMASEQNITVTQARQRVLKADADLKRRYYQEHDAKPADVRPQTPKHVEPTGPATEAVEVGAKRLMAQDRSLTAAQARVRVLDADLPLKLRYYAEHRR
jgi:hypothetical protein